MSLSVAAIAELHSLQTEAEIILRSANVSRAQQKRADVIMSSMSAIRATGMSSDELHQVVATHQARDLGVAVPTFRPQKSPEARAYSKWLKGASEEEIRQEVRLSATPALVTGGDAGIPAITYSEGQQMGFVVPMQYHKEIIEGQALYSPLLDPDVCTVVQETTFTHRPLQIPEWDLSQVAAVLLGETQGQTPNSIPTLQQPLLNTFRFNTSFNMTIEWEQDAQYDSGSDPIDALARANGVALARGINTYLINGDGVTGPQGILNAIDSGVVTAASNQVGHDDFSNVSYSIDHVYRNSPKCAWLVTDAIEKQIRNLKDSTGRPLYKMEDDVLKIFGKPVYTAPDLPLYNPSLGTQAAGSFCVFGDLSKYVIHASAVLQRRFTQTPGLIEAGMVRFHSQQLIDAVVCNPSPNGTPAIVTARLHE
jgi:HK97 family phage major capsid protein